MNIALIFAGGTGQRMNAGTIPKQFLEMHGKPILIYTLEQFDDHDDIDGIIVVCLEEWISRLKKMLKKFDITKVKAIVPGGATGQDSIYQGLRAARQYYQDQDIVLVHDGVRPLIDSDTISKAIRCTEANGNAITVSPVVETITVDNSDVLINEIVERSRCMVARAPQCFHLGDLFAAHTQARSENLLYFIDSACLMKHYGHVLHWISGPDSNIKITTPTDFYLFRAIRDVQESSKIHGL